MNPRERVLAAIERGEPQAAEALALARGGISVVARATGMSRNTIRVGIGELNKRGDWDTTLPLARVGRPGGVSYQNRNVRSYPNKNVRFFLAKESGWTGTGWQ